MKEKIKKPDWLIDSKYLEYSYNIRQFMEEFNLEDLKDEDINFLRDYYKKDKERCLNLIDELIFRGFKFDLKKENNMLKNIDINHTKEIILVSEDKQKYKNINFDRLGLLNFINRFKVKNDYFFNYIKLDYFTYLNKDIKIQILKEELDRSDITYLSYDKYFFIEDKEKSTQNQIKISDVFCENGFNLFVKYCSDNKIIYIEDLNGFDFEKLYSVRGMGKGKICKIKSIYKNIKKSGSEQLVENTKEESNKNFYNNAIVIKKDFYSSNIESLYLFDVTKGTVKKLKLNFNINKIEEFEKYKLNELITFENFGKAKMDRLVGALSLLKQEPNLIYSNIFNKIKENKNFYVYKLRCKKITLEQIGIQEGVTRERIRQKERIIMNLFISYFDIFGCYFKESLKHEGCITDEDILSLFNEYEDVVYIKNALKNGLFKSYEYVQEVDKIINKNFKDTIYEILNFITENMPNIFKIEDEIENINDIISSYNIDFIDEDEIIFYLTEYGGYKKIKDYLWKRNDTWGKLYAFVIKEYFPNGIKIYSEEINKFKSIINNEFGIDQSINDRAIQGRIMGEEEIVLYNRGTYIHSDNIYITIKLLNEIKEYIDSNKMNATAMVDLFSKFKEKLKEESNIDNRFFLQGVMKYYYKDEYQFTRDTICKRGEFKSPNKILEEYLYENKGEVNLKNIKEHFPGWNTQMLSNSSQVNKNIMQWGYGSYIHKKNINITEEELCQIREILKHHFEEGIDYVSIYTIFNKIKLRMRNLFRNNKIKNPNNLFHLLENFLQDDYIFRRNIIYRKDLTQYASVFEIYANDRNIINYDEFCKYFEDLKFRKSTIYAGFRRLRKNFMQVNLSDYIKIESLKLNDENLQQIVEFINNKLINKKYISIYSINDFRDLPDIGYEWSYYILTEIIYRYIPNFKIVEAKFKDRRYRRPIIVDKNSDIEDIVDVIIYIIKYEYKDPENLTISKIKDYFITNDIFVQSIPNEFYESERILVDEYGRITIKEKKYAAY